MNTGSSSQVSAFLKVLLMSPYQTAESSVFEHITLQAASWSSVLDEGFIMGPSYAKASSFLD